MLDIRLAAFTGRDLQAALQILISLDVAGRENDGKTARDRLVAEIEQRSLPGRAGAIAARVQARKEMRAVRPPCPSCQRGVLSPVNNEEGLAIVACHACRYSRVEGAS